jgi:hypothetical protein
MPRRPIRIEFAPVPNADIAEAAARRRMRAIEIGHPAVLEWFTRLEAPHPEQGERLFGAQVRARIVGGRTLSGDAHGHDALAALRLAFNGLEAELEADQARARARAATWLAAVRQRMRGAWPELR